MKKIVVSLVVGCALASGAFAQSTVASHATPALVAEINTALAAFKWEVGTSANVTNGQAVTLSAGIINILKSIGAVANGTNTVTLANFSTANLGKVTIIANSNAATNVLVVAKSGNWVGPAINLDPGESVMLVPTATNVFYSVGNQ